MRLCIIGAHVYTLSLPPVRLITSILSLTKSHFTNMDLITFKTILSVSVLAYRLWYASIDIFDDWVVNADTQWYTIHRRLRYTILNYHLRIHCLEYINLFESATMRHFTQAMYFFLMHSSAVALLTLYSEFRCHSYVVFMLLYQLKLSVCVLHE